MNPLVDRKHAEPQTTAGRIVGGALAIVLAVGTLIFILAFATDWRLPGLYMDAVNPEYIIPGILDPLAPGHRPWILPGNAIFGRFPLFTGSLYHGSTQLYFALPWMAVFGATLGTLRFVEGLVGLAILLLIALFCARSAVGRTKMIAAATVLLIAIDPSFVMSLRTQAYSCLFPLVSLLACVHILYSRDGRSRSTAWLIVSGVLFAVSVFSYFIYLFFLPALLWLLLRRKTSAQRRSDALAWACGCVLGFAPIFVGLLLLKQELGGWHYFLHWLRDHGEHLQIAGNKSGFSERLRSALTAARSVLTGRWPRLMILRTHSDNPLGSIKAAVLVSVPIVALAYARLKRDRSISEAGLSLFFAFGFLAIGIFFGDRLDGHHYTAILPFLYAAFAVSVAAMIGGPAPAPRPDAPFSRWQGRNLTIAIAVAAVGLVAVANAEELMLFHRDLRATGGVGLYSDAIDRFASDVARDDGDATVYFPDWGFVMPFTFLTRARIAQLDSVDPIQIHRELCAAHPQIVIFSGTGNESKFDLIAQLAEHSVGPITSWTQRDGKPVFQSMRLSPPAHCAPSPEVPPGASDANPSAEAWIKVEPPSLFSCAFLSPVAANVHWGATALDDRKIQVAIANGDQPLKAWIQRSPSGHDTTGKWALPGMRFVLTDATSGKQLAETSIASAGCPVTGSGM